MEKDQPIPENPSIAWILDNLHRDCHLTLLTLQARRTGAETMTLKTWDGREWTVGCGRLSNRSIRSIHGHSRNPWTGEREYPPEPPKIPNKKI